MDVGEVVAIALAGLAAGAINTVVGSGTLITFPVLLAFGYAPVTANVSNAIVLVFIAIALVLVVIQPKINEALAHRPRRADGEGGILTPIWVFACGVYGGYFGAAQGILLLGLLGITLPQRLQRTNALKNILTALVTGVAGVYFAIAAHVEWAPAGIIAGASIVGGQIGAHYGRRLHPTALRGVIVVVGVSAI